MSILPTILAHNLSRTLQTANVISWFTSTSSKTKDTFLKQFHVIFLSLETNAFSIERSNPLLGLCTYDCIGVLTLLQRSCWGNYRVGSTSNYLLSPLLRIPKLTSRKNVIERKKEVLLPPIINFMPEK